MDTLTGLVTERKATAERLADLDAQITLNPMERLDAVSAPSLAPPEAPAPAEER